MDINSRSLRKRLVEAAHYVRSRTIGWVLTLMPLTQIKAVSNGMMWESSGNDPQFDCNCDGFPLKAGWYLLRGEFGDADGDCLEPMLYFDYGHGMHEAWTIHLNFIRPHEKRFAGVVLLPGDVYRLRFDPASMPGTFCAKNFSIRRLGRMSVSWRMFSSILMKNTDLVGLDSHELVLEAWRKLCGSGSRQVFAAWLHGLYLERDTKAPTYERWIKLYDRSISVTSSSSHKWLISILLPTYNTPEQWLRRCLDSVLAQTYSNWELCVADDGSFEPQVRVVLEEYAHRDQRLRITWRECNGHISAASNTALAMARGDYIALLDHDDELHPEALSTMVEALLHNPQWQFVYSDEDKIDADGRRFDPYFKPDWNADLLCGQNCVSHLGVYARELVKEAGGFQEGLEGSQDWDLALRCSERLQPAQIGHVPRVLYHWRAVAGSTALGVDQKSYAHNAGKRAVQEHFFRRGIAAEIRELEDANGVFRVRHPLPSPLPKISIIIPTRDRIDLLQQCISSILERTTYPHYEIIIVDNQSTEPESLAYFASVKAHTKIKVSLYDHPFNYSDINNDAVRKSDSELVCLLNNDVDVITPDWLEELASHAMRVNVGAVGAMLYYPNGTIQHAGVITGVHGVAAHPYCGMPRGHGGQMARAKLTQAMSAVTAACLMVRRDVYLQVGGLDASLQVAFNDVDFCLRLRQHGYTNIWTPFAELYHHESASRGLEDTPEKKARFTREVEFIKSRWGSQLENDPAYNANLTLSGEPFSLAFPPREWRNVSST